MEDIEREQLIEFIMQSLEDLYMIRNELSSGKLHDACYLLGTMVGKHESLIAVVQEEECDECDEEYINKCSEACEVIQAIRALHKQANQCRK